MSAIHYFPYWMPGSPIAPKDDKPVNSDDLPISPEDSKNPVSPSTVTKETSKADSANLPDILKESKEA